MRRARETDPEHDERPRRSARLALEFMARTRAESHGSGALRVSPTLQLLVNSLDTVSLREMPPNVQAELRREFEALVPDDEPWARAVALLLSTASDATPPHQELTHAMHQLGFYMLSNGQWDQLVRTVRVLNGDLLRANVAAGQTPASDEDILLTFLRDTDFVDYCVARVPETRLLEPLLASAEKMNLDGLDVVQGLVSGAFKRPDQAFLRDLFVRYPRVAKRVYENGLLEHAVAARAESAAQVDAQLGPLRARDWRIDVLFLGAIRRNFLPLIADLVNRYWASLPGDTIRRISSNVGCYAEEAVFEFLIQQPGIDLWEVGWGVANADRIHVLPIYWSRQVQVADTMKWLMDAEAVECLKWAYSQLWACDVATLAYIVRYAVTEGSLPVMATVLRAIRPSLAAVPYRVGRIRRLCDDIRLHPASNKRTNELLDLVTLLIEYGYVLDRDELFAISSIPDSRGFDVLVAAKALPLSDADFLKRLVRHLVRYSAPALERLADMDLLEPVHFAHLTTIPDNAPWLKRIASKARPVVSAEMGRIGYWIDSLSAMYGDPDNRAALWCEQARGQSLASMHITSAFLIWTCRLSHSLAVAKQTELNGLFDKVETTRTLHWAWHMRHSGVLLLAYIKLHPELQRVGLGQHRMQVTEQAVTRAHAALGIDHVVLDFVHAPSFFASDVRWGWHDLTGRREREGAADSLYEWFGHKLHGPNMLLKVGRATDRVWSTPMARAMHRATEATAIPSLSPVAKIARLVSNYLSSDAPTEMPDFLMVDMHFITLKLERRPLTRSDADAVRLKHHLLRLGNRDRIPCLVAVTHFDMGQMDDKRASLWQPILLLLLIDLGRVWWRPLLLDIPNREAVMALAGNKVMRALTPDPLPRFDEQGLWVPQPRPPSYARPKNPDDETERPMPLQLPAVEPPLVWLTVPGRDPAVDPYAPGQPPPFPGRYDHDHDLSLETLMSELHV